MLLLVTGSSCSGKTTAAFSCADLPRLVVHDSDERGVPSNADTAWRQRELRWWVREAIRLEEHGVDLLLTGQSPIGELLAVPEVADLRAAVCLLDVADEERRRRLAARDPGTWSPTQVDAFLGWARWHRRHAADPAHAPEVIVATGEPGMRWERWLPPAARPRAWQVEVIDTTGTPVLDTVSRLREWISRSRGPVVSA
ncbi:hypothetical protein Bra3105_00375 [Brachybacterium halotolerans subsp. kimchii]|uniref:hypothetical protein n=1 Tax=Brachybacterium halotolerans TaxID=2795215 RepID=UPI001E2929C3|nr:hypothetical protein [Brachybacterium halotolerans]UEJ82826.1 hypothetical protein Bra3105_00375 [Brachybacterium halotolerans subsp. kimchii]